LPLYLAKYHAIKAYPAFNYSARNEDASASRGLAPCILVPDTKWRWMVSFMPRPLYPRENSPGTHNIGARGESKPILTRRQREKIPSLPPAWNRTPFVQPVV